WLGVRTICGTVLKDHSTRTIETHCSRGGPCTSGCPMSASQVLGLRARTTMNLTQHFDGSCWSFLKLKCSWQKQADLCEFKASLDYRARSRTARATQSNPVGGEKSNTLVFGDKVSLSNSPGFQFRGVVHYHHGRTWRHAGGHGGMQVDMVACRWTWRHAGGHGAGEVAVAESSTSGCTGMELMLPALQQVPLSCTISLDPP
ncbi:hypothetical protein LEMLEM_LOCUS27518, partial [Lemmus lemmus]